MVDKLIMRTDFEDQCLSVGSVVYLLFNLKWMTLILSYGFEVIWILSIQEMVEVVSISIALGPSMSPCVKLLHLFCSLLFSKPLIPLIYTDGWKSKWLIHSPQISFQPRLLSYSFYFQRHFSSNHWWRWWAPMVEKLIMWTDFEDQCLSESVVYVLFNLKWMTINPVVWIWGYLNPFNTRSGRSGFNIDCFTIFHAIEPWNRI